MVLQPSDFIALGALIFSALSLLTAYASYRHSVKTRCDVVQSQRPNVEGVIHPVQAQAGWYLLNLTLRSRDNLGYAADSLTVRRPMGAKLLNDADAMEDDGVGSRKLRCPLPQGQARRAVTVYLQVNPAGTTRGVMSPGDKSYANVYLKLPRTSARGFWLRAVLTIHSREAVQRALRIPIKVRAKGGLSTS
jgi:hypothetical protein